MLIPSWITAGAATAHLALAVILWWRGRRRPLTLALAGLNFAFFAWHSGVAGYAVAGTAGWGLLEAIGSIGVALAATQFFVTLLGSEERLRRLLALFWLVGGGATVLSIAGTVWWGVGYVLRSWSWNLAFSILFMLPAMVAYVSVCARAYRPRSKAERLRNVYVAVACLPGLLGGLTELAPLWTPSIPRLGPVGSVLSAALLMIQTSSRARMLDRQFLTRDLIVLLVLGSVGAVALMLVAALLPGNTGALLLVGAVLLPSLLFAGRYVLEVRRTREERVRQLAVIGEMAAIVAHEVRNPLAAIRGAAQYLKTEVQRGSTLDDATEFLDLIDKEVERLNEVVEDYQYFARPRKVRRESMALGELVHSVLRLHAKALPAGVEVREEIAENLPLLEADPRLVRQAVLNIVRNAAQAMAGKGVLTVRVFRTKAGGTDRAVVEVTDTGVGMSEDSVNKMFDPGESTKAGGAGLGLTVVRRVVEAHGGEIVAESAPGQGTVLSLRLPLDPDAATQKD